MVVAEQQSHATCSSPADVVANYVHVLVSERGSLVKWYVLFCFLFFFPVVAMMRKSMFTDLF